MSEYEIASLFYQVVETSHAALAKYLTVVFAVLVVSYFVADKLGRSAWIFLLGVYALFSIGMTIEIVSLYSDKVRLGWEMAKQAGGESNALAWHGMATSAADGPRWVIPVTAGCMCVFALLGSLFFFFPTRKRGNPAIES